MAGRAFLSTKQRVWRRPAAGGLSVLMWRRGPALLLLVLSLLVSSASLAQGAGIKDARAELESLKQSLDEKRAALQDLDNKERSLIVALGELDETLAALEDEHRAARKREDERRALLERATAELARDEERLAEVQARLRKRLRALYVLGEGGGVRALIGAESFEDLSYRRRLLETLAKNDVVLVEEHARARQRVEERRALHAALLAEAQEAARRIEEERELLALTREERAAAIARIDAEKELHVRAVKEIVERQKELGALVHKVSRGRGHRAARSGVLKDGLAWPVRGTLIRRFGTIREKGTGARITSNGLHIRAPLGTPVTAAAEGTVVHVGWLRGFGRIVIVDHGEGHHTLHAHLGRTVVESGQMVAKGETLALVGETESLNGPKLYFELRSNGRAVDPEPFLR